MAGWVFLDYIAPDGENVVEAWQKSIGGGATAKFLSRIQYLRSSGDFMRPAWGKLSGDCDGLYEIRFEYKKVQYRPLCCFGPGPKQVTILAGATKKSDKTGQRFDPSNACAAAHRRMQDYRDEGRTREHAT